ncbi:MAG: hypothetical protein ACTSO7_13420 [Candidatus Heimdallarchaeota archaeon]
MPGLRTENIRCIMCNKHLDLTMRDHEEKFVCSVCQAYFCSTCMREIQGYRECPAAHLLGASDHELKIIKLLPPSTLLPTATAEPSKPNKVKILPRKKVKILDEKKQEKNNK